MRKLRTHYRDEHPQYWKGWGHLRARKKRRYDPEPEPEPLKRIPVTNFKDYRAGCLIRMLKRIDGSLFPEFAFYVRSKRFPFEALGFTKEAEGKYVYRGPNFNIFVYGVR
jgi:hypothetical protein